MIAIDIEMPKCCIACKMLGREKEPVYLGDTYYYCVLNGKDTKWSFQDLKNNIDNRDKNCPLRELRDLNDCVTTIKALENGTPLPKGHGRLIDENEIKQMIEDSKVENETSKNFAENIIRFAPTIIEADKGE